MYVLILVETTDRAFGTNSDPRIFNNDDDYYRAHRRLLRNGRLQWFLLSSQDGLILFIDQLDLRSCRFHRSVSKMVQ